jgi:hypothetical protein
MKKLFFILLILTAKLSYASFPVNNIYNQIYNQSEIDSESTPIIAYTLIFSYIFSIIWYFTKPIPKDIEQKKKFFKKLRFIIFSPLVLFLLIFIYAYSTMSISF